MGGRLGWIEQGVRNPDVDDVANAEAWVFEQMRCLGIDFERVIVVESLGIQ